MQKRIPNEEVIKVSGEKIRDVIANLEPSVKKELLNNLVNMLIEELTETEKKELLQRVAAGGRKSREMIEMVEH